MLTSGASGASFDGLRPVARGVQGPLTITFPMYWSSFWARFCPRSTLRSSGLFMMKSVVTALPRNSSSLSTFITKGMLVCEPKQITMFRFKQVVLNDTDCQTSYDLEMKTRKQNRNNKQTEIVRFD